MYHLLSHKANQTLLINYSKFQFKPVIFVLVVFLINYWSIVTLGVRFSCFDFCLHQEFILARAWWYLWKVWYCWNWHISLLLWDLSDCQSLAWGFIAYRSYKCRAPTLKCPIFQAFTLHMDALPDTYSETVLSSNFIHHQTYTWEWGNPSLFSKPILRSCRWRLFLESRDSPLYPYHWHLK